MTKLTPRTIFFAIAILCLGFLLTAWYLQYGPQKQQPCPLCILQRYAYIALGVICFIAALHQPGKKGLLAYILLADLCAVAGMGFAAWQVSKGASMTTCLADPIGEWVNGLPMANQWPAFFFANGNCADQYTPILGLSVPTWSLIWFGIFTALIGSIATTTLRSFLPNRQS